MAEVTEWMEYGEPLEGHDRVHATKRVVYETGPLEDAEDDVINGTIPMDILELWDESEHVHEDGSLLLSALDDETRKRIDDAFEEMYPWGAAREALDDYDPEQSDYY